MATGVSLIEYDVFGQITAMKLPSGGAGDLWRRQEYGGYGTPSNQSGLLTRLQVGSYADADALLKLEYGYDSYGNVKTLSENGGAAASFGYDDQSRLTSAFGRSFGWRASGNFLSFEGKSASYGGAPLHGMNTLDGVNVYDYDAAGNVTMRSVGGVTQTLGWTAANELRYVAVGGVAVESYRYDDTGERIVRAVANGPVQYVYFPHYETNVQGGVSTITRSYFFGSQRVAQKVGGGALTYLHGDHLGSTVLTTGVSGSKTYHAYGATRSGSVPTEWQYTGQEGDGTGLVYLHARYYDPATGQFLSPDTLVPDPSDVFSYNRYMYSRGNPLRYTDPTGYYSDDEIMQHFGCSDWACVMSQFGDGGILAGLAGWLNVLMLAQNGDSVAALAYQAMPGGMGALPNTYEGAFLRQGSGVGSIMVQMARVTLADGYTASYAGSAAGSSNQFARLAGASTLHGSYALSGHGVSAGFGRSTYTRNACNTWDCTAIGLDVASLGVSIGQTAAAACTAVTLGACSPVFAGLTYADIGINGLQLAHSSTQYLQGEASLADMSLAVAQTAPSSTPVIGMASDAVWLAYDIFVEPWSPTHRWGTAKAAR